MRIIKHFIRVAKSMSVRIFCKHSVTRKMSCPFTGRTYIMCERCLDQIGSEVTKSEQ